MSHRKFRLGVIASSVSLTDCANRVAEVMHEDIQIAMARGLDDAIPVGKEMERAGTEVIISRRGAAHLLRESLRIPVLALPVSSLDILAAVKEATGLGIGKRILLPVFRNRLKGLKIIEEIFGIELVQEIYKDNETLENVVATAREQEIDVVIGGGVTMRFARKYKVKGVEIKISEEAVTSTIEDAKSVARSTREEQERTMRYRCIMDSTSDGIISVNEDGEITTINKAARELLKINDDVAEGADVARYIPRAHIKRILQTRKPEYHKLENINGSAFVTNHIPIMMNNEVMGAVSTFRDVSNVIKAENEVRRSFAKGLVAKYFVEDLIHKSPLMGDMIKRAKRFALSDSTIRIPPLRERIEDLPLLVDELIQRLSRKYRREPIHLPPTYLGKLMLHPWPGNVRQLENFVERLLLLSDSEFSGEVFHEVCGELSDYPSSREVENEESAASLKEYLQIKSQDDASKMIRRALEECSLSKSKAAKKLGISRTTLWRKLKDLEESPRSTPAAPAR